MVANGDKQEVGETTEEMKRTKAEGDLEMPGGPFEFDLPPGWLKTPLSMAHGFTLVSHRWSNECFFGSFPKSSFTLVSHLPPSSAFPKIPNISLCVCVCLCTFILFCEEIYLGGSLRSRISGQCSIVCA